MIVIQKYDLNKITKIPIWNIYLDKILLIYNDDKIIITKKAAYDRIFDKKSMDIYMQLHFYDQKGLYIKILDNLYCRILKKKFFLTKIKVYTEDLVIYLMCPVIASILFILYK